MERIADTAQAVAIIPARLASNRFPEKVIQPIAGKPLVVHTYEQAIRAETVKRVLIATDNRKVVEAVAPFGIEAVMTRPDHPSGTDRIAEVAESLDDEIIVNVQGDEPLLDPATLDDAVRALAANPDASIATARHAISDPRDIDDPNVVKVVTGLNGRALYFSRSRIPYMRTGAGEEARDHTWWQHIGLYVYRRDFLLRFPKFPQTPLEQAEKLEQLRALENGYAIVVVDTDHVSIGVDTPEDLERVRQKLELQLR